jgi:EVE domain
MKTRYWIGVVSKSHVENGVKGGFAQLCHGKSAPLKKMNVGDWLVYYSPKTDMLNVEPLQTFSAIGRVVGDSTYEFKMSEDFIPFRRDVAYVKCRPAPIKPLIEHLSFIKDPKRWGFPFKNGHIEMTESDFIMIANAMQAAIEE